jgi:hypothetical protein
MDVAIKPFKNELLKPLAKLMRPFIKLAIPERIFNTTKIISIDSYVG